VYALVVGKNGPKLTPAEVQTPEPNESQRPPRDAVMMRMSPDGAHLKARSATLSRLADMISRFTERPVIDMTDIKGQYDFDLTFMPETMQRMPMMMQAPGPKGGGDPMTSASDPPVERAGSIYESVQRYGLRLEARKAPLEILVVDHIEKSPTGN
jgi:uncharacterized protein (TIGR03435 family)